MIIVLKPRTSDENVKRVENMVRAKGLEVHTVKGEDLTIIGQYAKFLLKTLGEITGRAEARSVGDFIHTKLPFLKQGCCTMTLGVCL